MTYGVVRACFELGMGAAIYRNGRQGEYIGGLRAENFDQLHHNRYIRRLINLREQIRRYARRSLLLCAIGEFVRFYLGRRQTHSLNHLSGSNPHTASNDILNSFHPIESI
jgi:hypothetical protein